MLRYTKLLLLLFIATGVRLFAQDTTGVTSGTIRVNRTPVVPYYKVNYAMHLIADPGKTQRVKVKQQQDSTSDSSVASLGGQPPVDNGWQATSQKTDPGNDTITLERGARLVFPHTDLLLSKYFSEQISYFYKRTDTPRVDTMHVGLWINKQGAVKRVYVHNAEGMPKDLFDQVIGASIGLKKWGTAGGYYPRKRFLRKQKFVKDNYYCDMYVIIASFPMTVDQKTSGARFMPQDRCLNFPVPPVKKRRVREERTSTQATPKE